MNSLSAYLSKQMHTRRKKRHEFREKLRPQQRCNIYPVRFFY